MPAFPIDLRMAARRALVVGGGRVGGRRVDALLHSGAEVTVVSPKVGSTVEAYVREGRVHWQARGFAAGDCRGMDIVVSAASDPEVGPRVHADAKRYGALVSITDVPDLCDFYFGAVARRGDVALGVFTDGKAPGMARRVRDELGYALDERLAERTERFAELRTRLKALHPDDPDGRAAFLGRVTEPEALDALRTPGGVERALARFGRSDESDGDGRVYIVGAGPGDPELLTLRAARLIAAADDLVVDALVPPAIYQGARGRVIFAGKRAGEAKTDQRDIETLLVELARGGRRVVRLKGGDPGVFGRAAEELEALSAAGIPVEIVPGVSSALAAPEAAGFTLTARDVADRVVIISGHRRAGCADPVCEVPRFDPRQTVVILMGLTHLERLCERAVAAGYPPTTPAAVVSDATLPTQAELFCTLEQLPAAAAAAALVPPATVILGRVARSAAQSGPRIGVTG